MLVGEIFAPTPMFTQRTETCRSAAAAARIVRGASVPI